MNFDPRYSNRHRNIDLGFVGLSSLTIILVCMILNPPMVVTWLMLCYFFGVIVPICLNVGVLSGTVFPWVDSVLHRRPAGPNAILASDAQKTVALMKETRQELHELSLGMLLRWEDQFKRECGSTYVPDKKSLDYAERIKDVDRRVNRFLDKLEDDMDFTSLTREYASGSSKQLTGHELLVNYERYMHEMYDFMQSKSNMGKSASRYKKAQHRIRQFMLEEGLEEPTTPL